MRRCVEMAAALMLLGATAVATPDDSTFSAQFKPTLDIPRLTAEVIVDGQFTESVWRSAAVAAGFAEVQPGDQLRPPVQSRALIWYDASNLYVGLIAYDDPSAVRVSMRDRDEIFTDDYFGIMLDTYGNSAWGYELFVNPYGVQADLRMVTGADEDVGFDIIWESRGLVTDSGYQVEIAIPFASLRFPQADEQVWRVNFWRDHQREVRRKYAWAAQDRDESCFICQWGNLTGIRGIEAGAKLEVLPSVIAFQSGEVVDRSRPNTEFVNDDPDAEFGLNVRYGLSASSSIEGTYNPDFSQVESDAGQIDVNTPFALFFSERRPFFQEGSDLWNSWVTVVHTRTINDPDVAAKFTGQFGNTAMAYLFARDAKSALTVPLQQQSILVPLEESWVNIARVKHSFGTDSYIGATITDRRVDDFGGGGAFDGGSGSTAGIDARLRLSKQYRLEIQFVGSHTEEPNAPDLIDTTYADGRAQDRFGDGEHTVALDGESFSGQAAYASLEFSSRSLNWDLDYWDASPTFRADNGFVTDNDYRNVSLWFGPYFRPNNSWLLTWEPSISIGRKWRYDGEIDPLAFGDGAFDEWLRGGLWFQMVSQTTLYLEYLNSRERFNGVLFPGISIATIEAETRLSQMIGVGARYNFGKGIRRSRTEPELAYQQSVGFWMNLKPTERLYIEPDFRYLRLDHRSAWQEAHPGRSKKIFEGFILRNWMSYQFTRNLFLRFIVEYDSFDDALAVEPLLTYKVNAFTKFYVGMASNYQRYDHKDYVGVIDESEWDLGRRQFFAKFQYFFRT